MSLCRQSINPPLKLAYFHKAYDSKWFLKALEKIGLGPAIKNLFLSRISWSSPNVDFEERMLQVTIRKYLVS
jgi:hypothetical protein